MKKNIVNVPYSDNIDWLLIILANTISLKKINEKKLNEV